VLLNVNLKPVLFDVDHLCPKFSTTAVKDNEWIRDTHFKNVSQVMGFRSIQSDDIAEFDRLINKDPRSMHFNNRGF
jgi:hypothetical protein